MKHLRTVALVVLFALVMLGAIGAWHVYRTKRDTRKVAEDSLATRDRALKGDSDAEQKLGGMYYYGRGVPQDYAQALQWYRKAADQGDPKAQYGIGYMYDTGRGVAQDSSVAFRWFEQAVAKGDKQAECALAAMYFSGRGVSQDRAKAALLYRRSADQGLARAEYDLGYMYYYGQGVPQDRTEARLWFRRAAEHGDERAKSLLGLKLRAWLVPFLVIQAMAGITLAFRPLSLNMWEPSEGIHDYRDWLSVGTGTLFLLTAGMSWYGYTHNLIWCWIYGVTGFQLLKWSLDAFALVLLYFVCFQKKPLEAEETTEAL
jgi:TPR repeat protein